MCLFGRKGDGDKSTKVRRHKSKVGGVSGGAKIITPSARAMASEPLLWTDQSFGQIVRRDL